MTIRRARGGKRSIVMVKVLFFLYIGISLFAIVWLRTAVVNLEYEIAEIDKLRADLNIEKKMVVAQRSNFFSAGNIEKVASKRLGMDHTERENIFFVKRAVVAGPRKASTIQ